MNAALAVLDFNISPAMVESQFDLRRGFADQPEPDSVRRLLDPTYAKADAPAAILVREGAGPFLQALRCADSWQARCARLDAGCLCRHMRNADRILSGVPERGGRTAGSAPLLYLLIWYVPVFIITQQTH